jgi:uncharacterized integral membrane protein
VVIMGVIEPARRSRKHLAAWSLTIVTLALLAATLVLAVLNTRRTGVSRLGLDAALSAAVLLYAASGRLIASRRPENAIGWLLASIGLALAIFTAIAVVASVFARRRHATPERRQQLRWLGYVGALTIVWILSIGLANGLAKGAADSWLGTALWSLTVLTPVVGIPLACVVAVLRYRLYDLDRIISRTVAYAVVTGLLIGVYAGLVLLATQVIGITSPVAVAGATLAAAALFGPLRSRVQQRVDHRFNRARYDAERLLAAFAARLTEELDADTVTEDLARSVHTALEPAHVSIWLSER